MQLNYHHKTDSHQNDSDQMKNRKQEKIEPFGKDHLSMANQRQFKPLTELIG